MTTISIFIMPKRVKENEEGSKHTGTFQNEASGTLKSLTPPIILLGIVVMSTVAVDEAFLGSFLAVYMKNSYQRDVEVTGTILMMCGIFYSLGTMILGYLTDRGLSRALAIMVGFLFLTVGTLLIDISIFGAAWPSYGYPGIMFGVVEIGSAMIQVCPYPKNSKFPPSCNFCGPLASLAKVPRFFKPLPWSMPTNNALSKSYLE